MHSLPPAKALAYSFYKQPIGLTLHGSFLLRLFLAPSILLFLQFYYAFTIRVLLQEANTTSLPPINNENNNYYNNTIYLQSLPTLSTNESFGACLMIKDDNDLLYEWLAYHYTVLPLRYVFVASDEGSRQDPEEVLHRWKVSNTNLEYWIVNSSDFVSTDPSPNRTTGKTTRQKSRYTEDHEVAHHSFIYRQRAFISKCVKFLKNQGLHWVTFIDTDEFLVMNRISDNHKSWAMVPPQGGSLADSELQNRSINDTKHLLHTNMRHVLPPIQSNSTFVNVLHRLDQIGGGLGSCHTIPRLLYGALENLTCPDAAGVQRIAQTKFHYHELSTLRFTQHARKGDFAKSKYGKVMMDLSRLGEDTIQRTPRNIHRPYKPECGPGGLVDFEDAPFYLNHYIGSWERYNSRSDLRRNRQEWEYRAYLTDGNSCLHAVYDWFPRFLHLVGETRAKYLLGVVHMI